jgi:hypothetical protein
MILTIAYEKIAKKTANHIHIIRFFHDSAAPQGLVMNLYHVNNTARKATTAIKKMRCSLT